MEQQILVDLMVLVLSFQLVGSDFLIHLHFIQEFAIMLSLVLTTVNSARFLLACIQGSLLSISKKGAANLSLFLFDHPNLDYSFPHHLI
jgi:hypothetical protein